MCQISAGCKTKSVGLDKMLHSAVSNLGLHCSNVSVWICRVNKVKMFVLLINVICELDFSIVNQCFNENAWLKSWSQQSGIFSKLYLTFLKMFDVLVDNKSLNVWMVDLMLSITLTLLGKTGKWKIDVFLILSMT